MSPVVSNTTLLAPGFRFHPTDEEIVRYYLKRKILKKPSFNAISVIDIYKSEPWDLPDKSKLKSRDLEWYFFSALDKKYGNGSRTNRATERGYWKTTGKDREIRHGERVVGMKKTLVYHIGRAPRGERTNWVMHEYRLTDEALEKAGIQLDAFVLCRVFQKSGSGPKNGEQYGAPFIEEEWEDDEAVFVPGQHAEAVYEEVANDDAFVEVSDIDQNLDIGNPSENATFPLNFYHGESSNHVEYSREFSEDNQKQPGYVSENAFLPSNFYYGESSNRVEYSREFSEDNQKQPVNMYENAFLPSNYYYGESSNHIEYSRQFSEENQKQPSNMSETAFLSSNFYYGESSNHAEYSKEFSEDNQKQPGNMSETAFFPSNFYYGESSNHAEYSKDFIDDYQKPTGMQQATESDSKPHHEHVVSGILGPNEVATNGKLVKDEFVLDPIENFNPADSYCLHEETYLDVTDYLPTNDGFFLEANDLLNPIDAESEFFDPDEYLSFIDADDQPLDLVSDQMLGSEIPVSDQEPVAQMHSNGGIEQVSNVSEHIEEHGNNNASSSRLELEATKLESGLGTKYPFIKQASRFLGSIPAPPAFASEFPSKDAALKLNSSAHASSSVHVMAGMIRVTDTTSSGNVLDWSNRKNGNVNIVLSFSLPQADINPSSFLPVASLLSGKTGSFVARGLFFLMVLVLIISVSLKFGTCIYTR